MNITATRTGFNVTLTIEAIAGYSNYEIRVYRNSSLYETLTTSNLTYNYTLPGHGNYDFDYRGTNGTLVSDYSSKVSIPYNKIDVLIFRK